MTGAAVRAHLMGMPHWSPAQSDVVIEKDAAERARDHEALTTHAAGATATRWVFILMAIVLVALVLLLTVGAHTPGGG